MHSPKKALPPKPTPSAGTIPNQDVDGKEARAHLDFLSTDFNQIDELDDTRDNYREFENLTGVVTSDMRFQALRRRLKESGESGDTGPAAGITPGKAEKSRMAGEPEPKPLTLVSEGRVVIVSAEEQPARDCADILNNSGLCCSICIAEDSRRAMADAEAKIPVIHGYFGCFSVSFGDAPSKAAEMSAFLGRQSGSAGKNERCFDMVLDMRSRPCYAGEQLPLGYYAVGAGHSVLHSALEEMPEMKGRFSKPRLVVLRPDRCIRGRHPQLKCDRCLQICPFAAIEEEDGRLAVDHYKCQGCGFCGLVCEAQAIEYAYPRPEELVADICSGLEEWAAVQAGRPQVILVDGRLASTVSSRVSSASEGSSDADADALVHTVEEVGRLSLDVVLTLLAAGAGSVTVYCDERRPTGLRRILAEQIGLGQEILARLKLPSDCLHLQVVSVDSAGRFRPLSCAPSSIPKSLATAVFAHSRTVSGGERLRRPGPRFQ